MNAEYSVEEVRSRFEAWVSVRSWFKATIGLDRSDDEYADPCINSRWQGWQAAYAERIKADEGAVPVACEVVGIVRENDDGKYIDWTVEGSLDALEAGDALYCIDGIEAPDDGFTELFANPPAQAAQSEPSPRCDKPGCNCATWKPEGCAWDDAEPAAQDDGMCNADNPARRCVCREEFGRRVCAPAAQGGAADPLADDSPLQSCRAFVESWRLESAGSNGHDVIANRNTVRRLVHIIDHLAAQPAQSAAGWSIVKAGDVWTVTYTPPQGES